MQLQNFMIPKERVITASPNLSLKQIASLMVDEHIGCVIVIDNTQGDLKPVGIITKSDLVKCYYENVYKDTPVKDLMCKDLRYARGSLDTDQVANEMHSKNLHYLVV